MKRLVTLLLCVGLLVPTVVFAQQASPEEKAAAQAAFAQIDAGLLAMPWSFGNPDSKPALEKLGTLISAKGVKVVVRNIKIKGETNPVVVKDWVTEKLYAFDKFQEAIKFQVKYIDQQAANPDKIPSESKDPLLIELNLRLESYWVSRGSESDEMVEPQRKSVSEWAWVKANSGRIKIKPPLISTVKLVKEGKNWKLGEIQVIESIY